MEDFKALNFLHAVEKVLNIHRDYLYMSKKKRLFTSALVALELAISILIYTYNVKLVKLFYISNPVFLYSLLSFHTLFVVHSDLLMVYYGPWLGKEFRKILTNLSLTHEIVKLHPLYKKFLSNLKLKCVIIIFSVIAVRITINICRIVTYNQLADYDDKILIMSSHVVFLVLRTWTEVRFVTGILMYYCLVGMMSSMMRVVNDLIQNTDWGTIKDNIYDFALVYRRMLDSVRQLEKCFGHHVLLSLALAGSHFVFTVYKVLQQGLATGSTKSAPIDNVSITFGPSLWYNLLLHTGVFIVVGIQSQRVPNEAIKMKRNLAKLLQIPSNFRNPNPYFQGLKDFHRLVSVQPLTIRLLPTLPVGMYILPAVLSLTVNYIIVSLQMTHNI